jgi:hypothetical protein
MYSYAPPEQAMCSVAQVKDVALQYSCPSPQSSDVQPSSVHISIRVRPVLMSRATASWSVLMQSTKVRVQTQSPSFTTRQSKNWFVHAEANAELFGQRRPHCSDEHPLAEHMSANEEI